MLPHQPVGVICHGCGELFLSTACLLLGGDRVGQNLQRSFTHPLGPALALCVCMQCSAVKGRSKSTKHSCKASLSAKDVSSGPIQVVRGCLNCSDRTSGPLWHVPAVRRNRTDAFGLNHPWPKFRPNLRQPEQRAHPLLSFLSHPGLRQRQSRHMPIPKPLPSPNPCPSYSPPCQATPP
jgi:hypothetical protein